MSIMFAASTAIKRLPICRVAVQLRSLTGHMAGIVILQENNRSNKMRKTCGCLDAYLARARQAIQEQAEVALKAQILTGYLHVSHRVKCHTTLESSSTLYTQGANLHHAACEPHENSVIP